MTTSDCERVLELFSAAVDLPRADQFEFLRRAAAHEPHLAGEVSSLLKLDSQADAEGFLQSSALQLEAERLARDEVNEPVGGRIGPFRILRLVGNGGMGTIYLAERDDDQYHRRVAIKVIKRGMDTDHVLQRFRNERQILANLNHPNIARLYTGGATDGGLPYFVMEFIEGTPLNEYAALNRLTVKERLKLFRKVCGAVQYAHQSLIVHRDLKPTNILVTGEGEPKLLDFGIAKLLDASAPEATATAFPAMTPDYASPEQIRGEPMTTATDVYSLGVVLYELLTGRRPYHITKRTPEEITRAICDQEPAKPSKSETPALAGGSTRLKSNPPADAGGSVRGDLDNIVLMALRKEAGRRYSSVAEFSEDIQRYLEGHPVKARKDTARYRTARFVGRHRIGVSAAAILLITLLAGIIGTTWQAHAARVQRARAERRFQDVRRLANSFMFEFHDAIKDLPGALVARQLVVRRAVEYLDSLAKEAGDDPALQSELAQAYDKVGSITFDVGQTIESHRKAMLLNEALVKAEPNNGEYRKQLSESYNYMSDAMKIAGRSTEAIEFAKKSLAIFQSLAGEHPTDTKIKALVADRNLTLGVALADAGDLPHALESDRVALSVQQELVSDDPGNQELRADLSVIDSHISNALADQGDIAAALDYNTKSFDLVRDLFQSDPDSARYRRSMWAASLRTARLQLKIGDSQALENCGRALKLLEALSTADPKDTGHRVGMAVTYEIYGEALAGAGRAKEAEANYRRAISLGEALVAEDAARAEARNNLARVYARLSRLLIQARRQPEARDYQQKAQALYRQSLAVDPENARIKRELAELQPAAENR